MSKTFAPGRLDVAAFAQAKASLSAHDSIQKYERLAQELRAPEADLTIDWQADGEQRSAVDGSRRPALHLRAQATLPLVPRHDECPDAVQLSVQSADFDAAQEEKTNPFAALAALKYDKPN